MEAERLVREYPKFSAGQIVFAWMNADGSQVLFQVNVNSRKVDSIRVDTLFRYRSNPTTTLESA